ncbi:MAG: MFS transporter [Nevskia sp.]
MDRRRLAVILAGAAAFVNLYAPQSLLPLLQVWMGHNAALAGLVVSSGTFGVALAAPFAGLLADRYGRRRVIVAAAFLVVIPALFIPLAQTPAQLIAARFVEGLFLPGIFAVTVAYAGDEWPRAEARAVTALYVAGTIGGGFCGRFLSGLVAEFAGWRWGFFALALAQLLLASVIRAWLPVERQHVRHDAPAWSGMLALLRKPALRGAYATGFALLFSLVGGFTYITLRLAAAPFGLGPTALSAIFAVYLVGMLATPWSGRLLNRHGHARVLLMAWAVAVAGLWLTLVPALPAVALGLCLFSAGLFFAQTTATSFVAESAGPARAAAVGLYVTCYYLGGSVGGVLPAPVWTRFGWPGVVALLTLAGLLSATIGWRSFRLAPAVHEAPAFEIGGEAP